LPSEHPKHNLLSVVSASARGARIAYVGSASRYKNLAVLFTAFERIAETTDDARLFVTLPPNATPPIRGVIGLGSLSSHQMAALYSTVDVLVLPSLVETVGLPLIEAAAHGVALIVADRPYARDVCGTAAVFFDPHSTDDLYSKLQATLEDSEYRARLGVAARARAADLELARPYEHLIALAADI
jgi:glycosyltransferase involved in cell wall biosynthesis